MSRWYAIHTKPRQEETALAHLERQGFDCHLPRARERRRARHRYTMVTLPLFPRYLFARLDLATQNTAPIRSTQGVVGLVRFGLDPAPLPEGFVERLREQDNRGCIPELGDWQAGHALEVTQGPFAGLRAVFAARDGNTRVIVLMELLGRTQRLALPEHQLRRVGT
ncbi:MAG: transcription/translation regulatory transformer protein RfaH [Candidatus Macondimonas sp.]